jgi:SAM-dependent methyltransferase
MCAEPNVYFRRWFEFFHIGVDEARTMQETMFICRCAPLPNFRKVLDACCGMGRHARALSSQGYSVIGIDRDADVIAKARTLAGGPGYVNADIRDYRFQSGAFEVAIVMSQSFGYFDATTNRDVVERIAAGVREVGRVIVDLWNQELFSTHHGEREFDLPHGMVRESKCVKGYRLFVHLDYPDAGQDEFEWQLFSPAEVISMAESVGLTRLLTSTEFDETTSPCPMNPRVQFLFERRGAPSTNSGHPPLI